MRMLIWRVVLRFGAANNPQQLSNMYKCLTFAYNFKLRGVGGPGVTVSQGDDSSLDVLGKADMPPGPTSKCRHGRMLPPKKRSKAAAAETGRTIEVDACRKKPRLLGLTVHRQSSCELCSAFFSLYTEGSHSRAEQLASLPLSESSFSLLPRSTAWDCTGSASTGFLPRLRKPMAFVPD